jgi:hypothetical protein
MPQQQVENTNFGREGPGLETRHCVDSQVRSLTARKREVRSRARVEKSVDCEFSARAHSLSRSACLPGLAPGSFGSSPTARTSDCGQVWRTCTTTSLRYGGFGGSRFAEPGGFAALAVPTARPPRRARRLRGGLLLRIRQALERQTAYEAPDSALDRRQQAPASGDRRLVSA